MIEQCSGAGLSGCLHGGFEEQTAVRAYNTVLRLSPSEIDANRVPHSMASDVFALDRRGKAAGDLRGACDGRAHHDGQCAAAMACRACSGEDIRPSAITGTALARTS